MASGRRWTGTAYKGIGGQPATLATGYQYNQPVIIPQSEKWLLPAGAFGENCGSV